MLRDSRADYGPRLAELAKGWSEENDILRNEGLFIGLDSVTCGIATFILNVWHPGRCFPNEVAVLSSTDVSDKEANVGI
jgi:hypothetical protein